MHYCPRCGENSPFGDSGAGTAGHGVTPLRIPVGSRIVHLDDIGAEGQGETEVTYGGTRFRVRRDGESLLLRPLE